MHTLAKVLATTLMIGLLCVPQQGNAFTFVDGPFFGESWTIRVGQGETEVWGGVQVGPYDYLRIDWVSGSQFEAPALMRNFTNTTTSPPWGQTSTFAWAVGPSTPYVEFNLVFNGDPDPSGTAIRAYIYNETELRMAMYITFSGSGGYGSFTNIYDSDPGRLEPIPEPTTIATLIGVGLASLVSRRRRQHRS